MLNLQIRDALQGASPGTVLPSPETKNLLPALTELVGRTAAEKVLRRAGRPGLISLGERELIETCGIEPQEARRIVETRRLFERPPTHSLHQANEVLRILPRNLGSLEVEVLLVVALSAQLAPIAVVLVSQGGICGASMTPRDVFLPLVRLNASAAILVHNHPSGSLAPSDEGVRLTNTVSRAGYLLGIRVLDHLIVAGGESLSFADTGLMLAKSELEADGLGVRHGV